jgi:hypothetical protein
MATQFFPAQIKINKILIINENDEIDITPIIGELSIFEDIYSSCVTGSVFVTDSFGLIRYYPLTGQERLYVEFDNASSSEPLKFNFWIYSVTNRETISDTLESYLINFGSMEMIANEASNISFAMTDIYSNMAAKVFKSLNTNKKFDIEATNQNSIHHVVFPMWKPFKALNWLASKAYTTAGAAGFMFFETMSGFKFQSIKTLLRAPIATYKNPTTGTNDEIRYSYEPMKTGTIDPFTVSTYEIVNTFDTLSMFESGLESSTLWVHDDLERRVERRKLDYLDFYDDSSNEPSNNPLVYTKTIFKSAFEERDSSVNVKNYVQTSAFNPTNYYLRTQMLREASNYVRIRMNVPGFFDLRCGMNVHLQLPNVGADQRSDAVTTKEEHKDPLLSGKWMVSAVRHIVTLEGYRMSVELIRDAYNNPKVPV